VPRRHEEGRGHADFVEDGSGDAVVVVVAVVERHGHGVRRQGLTGVQRGDDVGEAHRPEMLLQPQHLLAEFEGRRADEFQVELVGVRVRQWHHAVVGEDAQVTLPPGAHALQRVQQSAGVTEFAEPAAKAGCAARGRVVHHIWSLRLRAKARSACAAKRLR
jgi:hypothetical protein